MVTVSPSRAGHAPLDAIVHAAGSATGSSVHIPQQSPLQPTQSKTAVVHVRRSPSPQAKKANVWAAVCDPLQSQSFNVVALHGNSAFQSPAARMVENTGQPAGTGRATTPVVHKNRPPSPHAKLANIWAGPASPAPLQSAYIAAPIRAENAQDCKDLQNRNPNCAIPPRVPSGGKDFPGRMSNAIPNTEFQSTINSMRPVTCTQLFVYASVKRTGNVDRDMQEQDEKRPISPEHQQIQGSTSHEAPGHSNSTLHKSPHRSGQLLQHSDKLHQSRGGHRNTEQARRSLVYGRSPTSGNAKEEMQGAATENLDLKKRIMDLESRIDTLCTENMQMAVEAQRMREHDRQKSEEYSAREALAEQTIRTLQEEQEHDRQKLMEVEESGAREIERAQRKNRELENHLESLREMKQDHERKGEGALLNLLQVEESAVLEESDAETTVLRQAQVALRESELQSEVSALKRLLEKRDQKIADLARKVDVLETIQSGTASTARAHKEAELREQQMELQRAHAELQHAYIELQRQKETLQQLENEKEELKTRIFEASVTAGRKEIHMQEICRENETLQKELQAKSPELFGLRQRRMETERVLQAAKVKAREMSSLVAATCVEFAVAQNSLQTSFDDLRRNLEETEGRQLASLVAATLAESNRQGILLKNAPDVCQAMTQTCAALVHDAADTKCSKCTMGLAEMQKKYAEMEKRYSGLETTIEWLEQDKASSDQKCTDLQLMCVAYREKLQAMEATNEEHAEKIEHLTDQFKEELRQGVAAHEKAWEAEGAALRARESQLLQKANFADQHEQTSKALEAQLLDAHARLKILETENQHHVSYTRELLTKLNLNTQSPAGRPLQAQKRSKLSLLEMELGNLSRDCFSDSSLGAGARRVSWQEVEHALQEGRETVRGVRVHAVEAEASALRVSKELTLARARNERLVKRLNTAEEARIKAETSRVGSGLLLPLFKANLSVDMEQFRKAAQLGDVNAMLSMYQALQEEVDIGKEAAANGLQALQELRSQRIHNTKLEAELSLLQEARATAEGEVVVARQVMAMRAALEHSPGKGLTSTLLNAESRPSPLLANLAVLDEVLNTLQQRVSMTAAQFQQNGEDEATRSPLSLEFMRPKILSRGRTGDENLRATRPGGREGERVDENDTGKHIQDQRLASSLPPSLPSCTALPVAERKGDRHAHHGMDGNTSVGGDGVCARTLESGSAWNRHLEIRKMLGR